MDILSGAQPPLCKPLQLLTNEPVFPLGLAVFAAPTVLQADRMWATVSVEASTHARHSLRCSVVCDKASGAGILKPVRSRVMFSLCHCYLDLQNPLCGFALLSLESRESWSRETSLWTVLKLLRHTVEAGRSACFYTSVSCKPLGAGDGTLWCESDLPHWQAGPSVELQQGSAGAGSEQVSWGLYPTPVPQFSAPVGLTWLTLQFRIVAKLLLWSHYKLVLWLEAATPWGTY